MTTGKLAAWGPSRRWIAGVCMPRVSAHRAVVPDNLVEAVVKERCRRDRYVDATTEYPANGSFVRPHSRSVSACMLTATRRTKELWSSLTAD